MNMCCTWQTVDLSSVHAATISLTLLVVVQPAGVGPGPIDPHTFFRLRKPRPKTVRLGQ